MAALAIIGLSKRPKAGLQSSRRKRYSEHVIGEGPEQVLTDVPQRRPAEATRPNDAAQIALHQRDTPTSWTCFWTCRTRPSPAACTFIDEASSNPYRLTLPSGPARASACASSAV